MNVPGSATKPGHLYHEPAFPAGLPHQRGNADRWRILSANENWAGKVVVDWGCNAGFFATKIALEGAKAAHGFDIDHDAIIFARSQAIDHGVSNARFHDHDLGTFYYHEELKPDVVLLLSVLPWIERTEPNPWTLIRELFGSRTAYVELMYEGDGRAGMVGIKTDQDAAKWLLGHFKSAYPVGWTTPAHNGGIRRTIWRCRKEDLVQPKAEPDHTGSQAFVTIGEYEVVKVGRSGSRYDAERECSALHLVAQEGIAPVPVRKDGNKLWMTRIMGVTLAEYVKDHGGIPEAWFAAEAERICQALERKAVRHNDVRPENLIVGMDGQLHLIDFGWATWEMGPGSSSVPSTINPEFRAATDRESFIKVSESLCRK